MKLALIFSVTAATAFAQLPAGIAVKRDVEYVPSGGPQFCARETIKQVSEFFVKTLKE